MRSLLKATLKTGGASAGNLLLGAITMKVIAVILGPTGIGLYTLIRQTAEFSRRLGTVGGEAALVQGLASRKGEGQEKYLITTFWIFVMGCLAIIVGLLVFAPWISLFVFDRGDQQTINLIRALSLPAALSVIATYLGGVINGFRAIGLLALLQVLGAAAMALLAYPVSRLVEVGYPTAFIVMVSAPLVVDIAIGTWCALRAGWLTPLFRDPRLYLDLDSFRHFFSLAGAMLIVGLLAEGMGLALRSLVVHYDGLHGAGVFAVAWSLSMTYVMLVLSSFGTYYLPTLSQTEEPSERVTLIRQVLRLTTLLAVPLVIGVIVLKPLAIQVLFSSEFLPSLEIMRWMLIGDYFKVTAWVLAMPTLAYADMKVWSCAELLLWGGLLVVTFTALFAFDSIQGIGVGFLLVNAVDLAYFLYYVRSRHGFRPTRSVMVPWFVGLALVVGASWHTWSDTQVNWLVASLWIGAAVMLSWLSLAQDERKEVWRTLLRRGEAG